MRRGASQVWDAKGKTEVEMPQSKEVRKKGICTPWIEARRVFSTSERYTLWAELHCPERIPCVSLTGGAYFISAAKHYLFEDIWNIFMWIQTCGRGVTIGIGPCDEDKNLHMMTLTARLVSESMSQDSSASNSNVWGQEKMQIMEHSVCNKDSAD